MRLCTSSCRTCCPTNDASPCRNNRHNDRRLDACRLAAVSSHPRTTVRWISLRSGIRCGEPAVWLFAAIDLLLRAMFRGFLPMRISAERAEKLAWRSSKGRHFGSQPDALGVATRLAAGRLREAGIVLEPLLRSAGLSLSQINKGSSWNRVGDF